MKKLLEGIRRNIAIMFIEWKFFDKFFACDSLYVSEEVQDLIVSHEVYVSYYMIVPLQRIPTRFVWLFDSFVKADIIDNYYIYSSIGVLTPEFTLKLQEGVNKIVTKSISDEKIMFVEKTPEQYMYMTKDHIHEYITEVEMDDEVKEDIQTELQSILVELGNKYSKTQF
jgi:hypothetical protein